MKIRIITGVVGLALFFVIMAFYNTIIFDIILCLISLIAVHELLMAFKCTKNIPLTIVSMSLSVFPFVSNAIKTYLPSDIVNSSINSNGILKLIGLLVFFCGIILMLLILLKTHSTTQFSQVASAFLISYAIPFSFLSLVLMRNEFGVSLGIFYTLFTFACAWGSDTGAYFAGRFFGKHKLAPKISPNKTIEGLIGGVVSCFVFVGLVLLGFSLYMNYMGEQVKINYVVLIVLALASSLAGVLGDLSASIIKRQNGIKDFGYIFPGHGGVMDRFDSSLVIAPFVFIVTLLIRCVDLV